MGRCRVAGAPPARHGSPMGYDWDYSRVEPGWAGRTLVLFDGSGRPWEVVVRRRVRMIWLVALAGVALAGLVPSAADAAPSWQVDTSLPGSFETTPGGRLDAAYATGSDGTV